MSVHREKIPSTVDTDVVEIKALFGLLLFRGVLHDVKQPCEQLWYGSLSGRPIYRACMSYKRYQWLMRNLSFNDPFTLRQDFLNDRFARMRWILTKFEDNARKHYKHTEFVLYR